MHTTNFTNAPTGAVARSNPSKAFLDAQLATIRAEKARKVALIGDVSNGAILTNARRDQWAFLLPDVSQEGMWRMQLFDTRGFIGHSLYNSAGDLVAEAATRGFIEHDPGALDRLQNTPAFERGNHVADLMASMNSGEMSFAEYQSAVAAYDAAHLAAH